MKKDRIILDDIPFIDINSLHRIGAFSNGEQYFPYVALQYPFYRSCDVSNTVAI